MNNYLIDCLIQAVWDLFARLNRPQGLHQEQIRAFKQVRFTVTTTVGGTKEEVECPICLVEYTHNETVVELPCAHRFHSPCIKEWLKVREMNE